MEFNFEKIKNQLLSPGDIFWQKKSGDSVRLAKKGDVLNYPLIQKLDEAGHSLLIDNSIDQEFHGMFMELFENYRQELMMREKIKWREQIIEVLRKEFIETDKEQFELDILAWKMFSTHSIERGMEFIERDSELFKRNLSVVSSYTLCAFLLGYYDTKFLSNLFSSTLESLMELGKNMNALSLKEKLEYLFMQDTFNADDCEEVKKIADHKTIYKTVVFEKYDGSGIRKINSREMNDLENILVSLGSTFGIKPDAWGNALVRISRNEIRCEKRTLNTLQRILAKKEIKASSSVRLVG